MEGSPTGMQEFPKLPRLSTASFLAVLIMSFCATAQISSVSDGWEEDDDQLANTQDTIGFVSTGDEGTFYFELPATYDTYCIQPATPQERAGNYLIDGIESKAVHMWGYSDYEDAGLRKTIQTKGGTGNTCSFWFWLERNESCDGVWLTDSADYTAAGCTPDVSDTLGEGVTDNYLIGVTTVQITCLDAAAENYMKCQSRTYGDLSDCIADSVGDVNGGDNFALADLCTDNEDSGTDTEALCDVQSGNTWELAFLHPDHYASDTQFRNGTPESSFEIFGYDFCGTALFDRDLIGTTNLTVLKEKALVCEDTYTFNAIGYSDGYFPWFLPSAAPSNESFEYNEDQCLSPATCTDTQRSDDAFENLTALACMEETGNCYDGAKNRDETSVDYGGICGSCDNSSLKDDVYYAVARESYPQGYFDTNSFEPSFCDEGENNIALITALVLLVQILLIVVFGIILLFVAYVLVVASLPFLLGFLASRARKALKSKDKDEKNI